MRAGAPGGVESAPRFWKTGCFKKTPSSDISAYANLNETFSLSNRVRDRVGQDIDRRDTCVTW